MKAGQSASNGKNSRANVVFPDPFGQAMMTIFLSTLKRKSTHSAKDTTAHYPSHSADAQIK